MLEKLKNVPATEIEETIKEIFKVLSPETYSMFRPSKMNIGRLELGEIGVEEEDGFATKPVRLLTVIFTLTDVTISKELKNRIEEELATEFIYDNLSIFFTFEVDVIEKTIKVAVSILELPYLLQVNKIGGIGYISTISYNREGNMIVQKGAEAPSEPIESPLLVFRLFYKRPFSINRWEKAYFNTQEIRYLDKLPERWDQFVKQAS